MKKRYLLLMLVQVMFFTTYLKSNALSPGRESSNLSANVTPQNTPRNNVLSRVNTANNASIVLMSPGHHTYPAGTEPVHFYDDGGKEGNITEQFSGIVTFTPSTPGKKVLIRFEKLDLFNTSSTGLNDLLQVFDGKEVNNQFLKYTVLKELVTVRSTAADGSLTISLISKTGIPKPGFEAVVEEFTPQAMQMQSISVANALTTNVSSGKSGEQILKLNIRTEHTEPALRAEQFVFSATDCFQHIKKATLYYTGKENTFGKGNKAGEVVVDNAQITIPVQSELAEGDNYFWLTYDLNDYVPNGSVLDASAQTVVLSGNTHAVENGNPDGNRIVENKYVSQIGHFTEKVTATWMYTHRPNSLGSRYEAEIGDQIVTFEPMTTGRIIELEFDDFDIYYSSSSYGVRARYQIYSGKNTSGKLLWELKSAADKSIGPNRVLRSESADGAITVVFNANDSGSPYTAKGWHAQVREYETKPMELKSAEAFQASTAVVKPGALNQEIIGMKILTEGNLQPLTLDALNISLKGSSQWIDRISVYYTGDKDQYATTQKIAEVTNPAETVLLSLTNPLTLPESYSYYWIAYDMKPNVPAGKEVDAALLSVRSGTQTTGVTNGDPDGTRMTKNILDLQQGDNGTVTVTGSLMFYDDGGPENKYSKSMNSRVTFVPANPQNVIRLVFKSFVTHANDEMKLYHGTAVLSSHHAKYYGNLNSKLPESFVSNSKDGAVTVAFKSASYSTPTAGWEIEVQEYAPEPLSLGEIRVTSLTDKVYKGMSGEPLLKIEAKVNGDKGEFIFEEFAFEALNSTPGVIDRAILYTTDTISHFGPGSAFGQAVQQAPYQFTGTQKVTQPGIYHFWLTYDISPSAAENNRVEGKLSAIRSNGTTTSVMATDQISATVMKAFSGKYRVGQSSEAKYATLKDAFADIVNGIEGPVMLELEPGKYAGQILIPHIPGASEKNTITICSLSGRNDDVVFETNSYSEPPYGEEKNGMFTICGADYITIDGIKFTTSADWPSLLNIKNVSRNVTIRNCILSAKTWSDYSGGSKLAYMEAANKSNHNNDFVTFESCVFEGGTYGVYVNGTGYVALQKQRGARVIKNTFRNQGSCAVYVTKEEDALIDGNSIENILSKATNFKAIDAVAMEGTIIRNNIIALAPQNYASGIYLRRRDTDAATRRTRIYNNEINIYELNGTGTSYGINCTDPLSFTDIVYNTIRIARISGTGKGAGAYFYATASKVPVDVTFRNNIIQNMAEGHTCYITNTSVFGNGATRYADNVFYSSGTALAYAGQNIADIQGWKTIANDVTSQQKQVEFISNEILEPKDGSGLKLASPLSYVTTDIKGQKRHDSAPTIGAYEFTGVSDMPHMYTGYPVIGNIAQNQVSLTVKADNDGKVFYQIIQKGGLLPSVGQILDAGNSVVIRKDKEQTFEVKDLNPLTAYKVCMVLQNLKGENSAVLESDPFETASLPTVPSDFEQVTPSGAGSFTDGTASFNGFTVVAITDGPGSNNKKAAQWSDRAKITLTNTLSGLVVTGFYLKSEDEVTMDIWQGELKKGSVVVSAQKNWNFINLKKYGQLTSVELVAKTVALIDNFSGEPQKLQLMIEDVQTNEGTAVSFIPVVHGGVEPYVYAWRNALMETVGDQRELSFAPLHTGRYTLEVTDAWGSKRESSAVVRVKGQAYTATFEDLYLDAESHWAGDLTSKELMTESEFYSGSYAFNNLCMPAYNTWAFWGYSNETATTFTSLNDQFRSAVGSGVNGSATYAVSYADTHMGMTKVKVTHKQEGDSIRGFYVTNTAWVKDAILNGDGMSSQPGGFVQNDSLTLSVVGKNGSQTTGTVNFLLADYRDRHVSDHYYLDTWQWIDLKSLGKVTELVFRMNGSKTNSFGLTTPAYFCMDDFNGQRPENTAGGIRIPLGDSFINLRDYFSFNPSGATITYQLVDKYDLQIVNAALENDRLKLKGLKDGTTELVIGARQKGKREYIRIPLTVDPSVDLGRTDEQQTSVYYRSGVLYIQSGWQNYTVDLIAVSGVATRFGNNCSGDTQLGLSVLSSGIYIVKVNSAEGSYVTKIYVK